MDDSLATPPPAPQTDFRISFRTRLVAPLLTFGTIALLEIARALFGALPPSPSPLLLLILACGVFVSGLRSGLFCAAVVLGYLGFFFKGADGPWLVTPTIASLGRMSLLTVVAPGIVLIIGLLKRRLLAAERANAASQRREAEELLRLATETAGIGTFSYDPAEGGRMMVSSQCRKNYGVAPDTIFDFSKLVEIILPADRDRVAAAVQDALDPAGSGRYEIEYCIRRPNDGAARWVAVRGRALDTPDKHRVVVGATIDITDRKESERGMQLLKAAVESANDGVVITEAQLELPGPRIEYVNPAFCRMTGYSAEELIGKTPRILQGPRTDAALLRGLRSALGATETFHAETVNYRKNGQPYHVEWRITAVHDAAGRVTHWVAVQRDITGRVEADQERARLLETEQRTRRELERAGRLKDEFLATLSHELRTPLNAITGWIYLLKTEAGNPEMQRNAIEVIERNSKAQLQLIEDLLDVSRIVSGKMRVQLRPVVLADVVRAAMDSARPAAEARGVRLEGELGAGTDEISGDSGRGVDRLRAKRGRGTRAQSRFPKAPRETGPANGARQRAGSARGPDRRGRFGHGLNTDKVWTKTRVSFRWKSAFHPRSIRG